jgi:hypothetical protein
MTLQLDRCSSLSQTMKSTHTWKVSVSFLMHRHTNGSKECQAARFAHQLILHPFFPLEMLLIKNCAVWRPGSSARQLSKCSLSKHNNVCRRISGCWKKPTCPTAEILELKKTKPEREEERGILRKKSGDLIRSDSPCDWETFFQRNLELQALAHLLILHPLFPPPCSWIMIPITGQPSSSCSRTGSDRN